jgi:hypothetical protein
MKPNTPDMTLAVMAHTSLTTSTKSEITTKSVIGLTTVGCMLVCQTRFSKSFVSDKVCWGSRYDVIIIAIVIIKVNFEIVPFQT